jgi:aspartyl-tRNA(Asn)/glutamyl-tRNA(Gln) amidotransferase subunit C
MSKLTLDDVKRLARMANLPIVEDQLSHYPEQLGESLSYVENLSEIDTSHVPDTFFTTEARNVMAEDDVDESIMLTQEEALKNAKATKNGYFVVKRIL